MDLCRIARKDPLKSVPPLRRRALPLWFVTWASLAFTLTSSAAEPTADSDHFERKIRPLLSEHCYACHSESAKTIHAGLRLDSASGVKHGGDSGPLLVPGEPESSLLIQAVRYDSEIQMPPEGKLPEKSIRELTEWVRRGGQFPRNAAVETSAPAAIDFERGGEFWSFQPARRQSLPEVDDPGWPRTRLDFFVLAAMEDQGLRPSPPADRATLVRRLYFDLIGVPPTPREVQAFVADPGPNAYGRLIDRLIDSPSYGERWARWWLDLARYTDRTASWLYQTGQAHLYRDWVVRALNQDMPYDEFIRRQLATDLIATTGPEDLPALGFVSLSPTYWKELKLPCEVINEIVADEWEERVDAVSRTFIGLSVACARCHDHKFDPISSEDYYALAGIFASCRQVERPLISAKAYEPVRQAKARVKELETRSAKLKKQSPKPAEELARISAEIEAIQRNTPQYNTPMANALSEESLFVVRAGKTPEQGTRLEYRAEPRDLPAFIRGNPNRPGPIVPRRFLTVLRRDAEPYRNGSGRLELANSIIGDAEGLTARVIVNRIWLEHFGRGIVTTPSDFGQRGSRPSHPRLLDDLAARFVSNDWSIKRLHREILLSATWQQTSNDDPQGSERDPDNRWLSRMNRRRLAFEPWRDAMLVGSDAIDWTVGGPSQEVDAENNRRRSLYATIHRRDMSPTLMIHDFPDPTQHSPSRSPTLTSLQGLYALNGPLLMQQSRRIVERIDRELVSGDFARIERIYGWLFSRAPSPEERTIGATFVGQAPPSLRSERWQQYAQMLLASNEFLWID